MTLQDTFCTTLVDEWARAGVTDAVVAPGSRSTPLAVALAADHRLHTSVVLDERSAGFVALGLGLASGRPAVVLTTSGTAAVELHPAVVEAHQARVPVIVCTADRPPELHHVGAPQTVEQEGLFAGAVRWAHSPGVADAEAAGTWRSLASRAVAEATASPAGPGPVHLNLAFREPLTGSPEEVPAGRPDSAPWHIRQPGRLHPTPQVVEVLANGGQRGLIVAGEGVGDPDVVVAMARTLGWPLLAEPRSGCRSPADGVVAAADALLRVDSFAADHRPDLVVRMGAPWASRVVGEWLAALDVPQYLVDPYGAWLDPTRSATTVVAADPALLAAAVAAATPPGRPTSWRDEWAAAEVAAQAAFDAVLVGPLTEPGAARTVVDRVPAGGTLMVSSSMPIRDVEWYGRPRNGLRVLANRGTNGIDGVVSTAAGVALAGPGPTVVLVGDLAFLHDTNALLAPAGAAAPIDLTVVVVDNGGGGIFSFLPQAAELPADRFEQLLGTPHQVDLVAVAEAHGAKARAVDTLDELGDAVASKPDGVRVLVARMPDRTENKRVHDHLHALVAAALE